MRVVFVITSIVVFCCYVIIKIPFDDFWEIGGQYEPVEGGDPPFGVASVKEVACGCFSHHVGKCGASVLTAACEDMAFAFPLDVSYLWDDGLMGLQLGIPECDEFIGIDGVCVGCLGVAGGGKERG